MAIKPENIKKPESKELPLKGPDLATLDRLLNLTKTEIPKELPPDSQKVIENIILKQKQIINKAQEDINKLMAGQGITFTSGKIKGNVLEALVESYKKPLSQEEIDQQALEKSWNIAEAN